MKERIRRFGQRKFVRDTLVLQAASVVQNGTYLVTSLLTARLLGEYELGRWATSREIYMLLFFLVNMGLTNAAVSSYSKAKGKGDHQESVLALASFLKVGLGVSLAMALLGQFAAPALAERYYHDRQVGQIAGILCLATLGEVLRSLTLAILNGTRQMRRYATYDVATNILRVGLVGTALWVRPEPESVAWAFFSHGVISGGFGLIAYGRARQLKPALAPPPFREVLAAIPSAPLRAFFGVSLLLALGKAMNAIIPRLGLLFIPAVAASMGDVDEGFRDNGAYQVGNVLTMVLTGAIGAIATNALPTLGIKMGQSDVPIQKMGGMFRRLSLASGLMALGATLLSIPFVFVVVKYGYGEAYIEAFELYLWLATGNIFAGFAVICEPFYIYTKRLHHSVLQNLVYASLAAYGIYSATVAWGPMGAAAAGGLCRVLVLFHLVYIIVYFRRHGGRSDPAGPPGGASSSGPQPGIP